ncbi:MAG: tetratricopeptide repeat protein [Planctomycetota bacterium]
MPSIEQLQKLLALDESDTFVLYALAQELSKAGDHAGAVAYYDRCLAVDDAYCYAYFHKARSLEALGDMDAARETLAAGLDVARRVGDSKATNEIGGYLDELRLRS